MPGARGKGARDIREARTLFLENYKRTAAEGDREKTKITVKRVKTDNSLINIKQINLHGQMTAWVI